jgi:hypothetical protein
MIYDKFEKYNVDFTYNCILICIAKYGLKLRDIELFIETRLSKVQEVTLELKVLDLISNNSLKDIEQLMIKKNFISTQIDEYKYWYIYLKELEGSIEQQDEEWRPFADEYKGFYDIIVLLSESKTINIDKYIIEGSLEMEDKLNKLRDILGEIVQGVKDPRKCSMYIAN